MKSIFGLWTLIVLGYAAGASNWHTGGNGYSYFIEHERNYSWSQASDECSRKNMSLLTVDSKAEQQEIQNFLESDGYYRFVGGNFNDANKRYEWVKTGKPLGYTNWASGKPDKNTKDQCIVIYPNDGTWYNFGCSNKRGFICEEKHFWYDELKELKKTIETLQANVLVGARLDEEQKKTIENVKADVLVVAKREEELNKTVANLKSDVLVGARLDEELKKTIANLKADVLLGARLDEEQKKTIENVKADVLVGAKREEELNKTIVDLKSDVVMGARRDEELKKTIANLKSDVLLGARLDEELKKTIENLKADVLVVAKREEELNKTIANLKADVLVGAKREEELITTAEILKAEIIDLKEQKKDNLRKPNNVVVIIGSNQK